MSDRPIILMYSPDTIGLGHIKRHTAISMEVLREVPDANIVLLVGSGIGAFFELPKGVDSIKLPSVQKVGPAEWCPRTLSLPGAATRRLRAGLIRGTLETLQPDVFLVDHLPTGVWDELVPALELIRFMHFPTRVVLGLRDILDDPARVQQRWSAEGYYDVVSNYYDHVFIYGDAEVFPTAEVYNLEKHFAGEISYCGYVCATTVNGASAIPPRDMRSELFGSAERAAHKRLLVVTAGSGHDGYPMMSVVLVAMKQLEADGTLSAVMVTGPLMPEEQRVQLRGQSRGLPVTLLPWTMQLKSYLEAADVVITMGGYNSVLETVYLGKRAINIPRSGPSKEQTMRATLFDQLGLVTHVPLEEALPRQVTNAIRTTLDQPLKPRLELRLNGAQQAARLIRRLLDERDGRRAPIRSNRSQSPNVVY